MITFRKISESDRDELKNMMRTFYSSPAVMTNGSDEIFERDISECISDSPYASGFILEFGGKTAGYAMLAHSFSTEFGKPCVWVEDIYIIPKYRRLGIGSAFFEYLGKEFNDHVIRLEAERENKAAIALYEKSGFEALPYYELIKRQK